MQSRQNQSSSHQNGVIQQYDSSDDDGFGPRHDPRAAVSHPEMRGVGGQAQHSTKNTKRRFKNNSRIEEQELHNNKYMQTPMNDRLQARQYPLTPSLDERPQFKRNQKYDSDDSQIISDGSTKNRQSQSIAHDSNSSLDDYSSDPSLFSDQRSQKPKSLRKQRETPAQIETSSDKDSQHSENSPSKGCQNLYDILKFTGVMLYQVSYCLMIAYYYTANFAQQYILDIFRGFIVLRAAVVFVYSMCIKVFTVQQGMQQRKRLKRRKSKQKANGGQNKKDLSKSSAIF